MKNLVYFLILLSLFTACTKSSTEDNRFEISVLTQGLDEPTEIIALPQGRIVFAQRKGEILLYSPQDNQVKQINKLTVNSSNEDGILGMAADPHFEENQWIYIYYSHPTDSLNQLSRFTFVGESIDLNSEKVMLKIPTQRHECCHTGGSIDFDVQGLLYLSTGDNTNPQASEGYSPLDERAGRAYWDSQRTAGNTKDLRGKILRIKPEADGTYSIPEGNLFPLTDSLSKPEIYIMGCRNPYRMSIDQKTGFLYWGDIGPDAGQDQTFKGKIAKMVSNSGLSADDSLTRGPRGYDEINQARKAGFFGWPFFIANNQPYIKYNFETKQSGQKFDINSPKNQSVNNTGNTSLPPPQGAFIWYPYAKSTEFPILEEGGRNAMAGPVYYSEKYASSAEAFPDSYDGKLFIYDWMRGWIMTVSTDEQGNLKSIDPFLGNERFNHPIDMTFGDDGCLYVLEYGSNWFAADEKSRLLKISYNAGNRKPLVKIAADKTAGGVPLQVKFSSEGTTDYDKDALIYAWDFDGSGAKSTEANPSFNYQKEGIYHAILTVTDSKGAKASSKIEVRVGNEMPVVAIDFLANNTPFYTDKKQTINYKITVEDTEDGSTANGSIKPEDIAFSVNYMSREYDKATSVQGHQVAKNLTKYMEGKQLLDGSTCKACHQLDKATVAPAYLQIGAKYANADEKTVLKLAQKVIAGGSGNWGQRAMPAHPQFSETQASEIVRYVLSLRESPKAKNTSLEGTLHLSDHIGKGEEGVYLIIVSYTDKGKGNIPPITVEKTIMLRHQKKVDEKTKVQ